MDSDLNWQHSKSYNPKSCCGGHCFRYGSGDDEPCWGDVEVIDNLYDDENEEWLHSCKGHINMYPEWSTYDGKYIKEDV